MKIEIDNKTKYDTSDLRKIIKACIKRDGIKISDVWGRSILYVEVKHFKGRTLGRATYNGNRIKLYIRNPERWKSIKEKHNRYAKKFQGKMWDDNGDWEKKVMENTSKVQDVEELASTILHELQHLKGLKCGSRGEMANKYDGSWAKDLPLRWNAQQPKKEKPDLQLKRYNHVLETLQDKKKKKSRLEKQIKKWEQKRKYYEKVLVANNKLPKGESK